ncbi:hypothetical protein COT42_06170, partial [Candidatus Saganbacteria bacterium CG08_land_8_20_14_0_20_45_16]
PKTHEVFYLGTKAGVRGLVNSGHNNWVRSARQAKPISVAKNHQLSKDDIALAHKNEAALFDAITDSCATYKRGRQLPVTALYLCLNG